MLEKIKGNWNNENGVSSGKAIMYKVTLILGVLAFLIGIGAAIFFLIKGAALTNLLISVGAGSFGLVLSLVKQVMAYNSDAGYNS